MMQNNNRPDARTRHKVGAGVFLCKHNYPIEVRRLESGHRQARCLGCRVIGPVVRGDAENARQALLAGW